MTHPARREAPTPLRIGDWEAEPGLNELRGPDGRVRVEPKVMEVLLALARRPGETVAREALLEEVWGDKAVVEAVLTRCVSELRRVFADDPQNPRYIQTVARRGYRLVAAVEPSRAPALSPVEPAAAAAIPSALPSIRPGGPPAATAIPPAPSPILPAEPAAAAAIPPPEPTASGRTSPLRRASFALAGLGALAFLAGGWWLGRGEHAVPPAGGARDPEAYRLYLDARAPLRQAVCEGRAALALLDRSLELDPDFAPAWEEYGWARYNLVASCGESGDNYGRALEAASRALALAPASARAASLRAAVLVETGRVEEAYAFLTAPGGPPPRDPELRFLRAYVLTYAGYLEPAAAIAEELAAEDPTFFLTSGWTPNALLYRGRTARFLELLVGGESPLQRYYRGAALNDSGRRHEALRELLPAFERHPGDLFARLAEAQAALLAGRTADALVLLRQLALQRERLGGSDGEFTFKLAQLFARAGEPAAALRELERAVGQGFFCPDCIAGAPALGPLAGRAELVAVAETAAARHRAFGERFGLDRGARPAAGGA